MPRLFIASRIEEALRAVSTLGFEGEALTDWVYGLYVTIRAFYL